MFDTHSISARFLGASTCFSESLIHLLVADVRKPSVDV